MFDKSLSLGVFFLSRNADLMSGIGSKLSHLSRCCEEYGLSSFGVKCCESESDCVSGDDSGCDGRVEIGRRSAGESPSTCDGASV